MPFQQYAHSRWLQDFPQWAGLREDHGVDICYSIASPANPLHILWVVFTPDEILIKFAVPGSHEHYDPDDYLFHNQDLSESVAWDSTYQNAIEEYVQPVLEDRMVIVNHGNHQTITCDVEEFAKLNKLSSFHYESWSRPAVAFSAAAS